MKLKTFIPIVSVAAAIIISLFFVFNSCSPMSKESYMDRYEAFIEEVSNERDSYSDEDWKEIDEEYEQFNEEWYKKFEDELTWKEDLTLTKYSAQYNFYRYSPL